MKTNKIEPGKQKWAARRTLSRITPSEHPKILQQLTITEEICLRRPAFPVAMKRNPAEDRVFDLWI